MVKPISRIDSFWFWTGTASMASGFAWIYLPLGLIFAGVLMWLFAFGSSPDKGVTDDQRKV